MKISIRLIAAGCAAFVLLAQAGTAVAAKIKVLSANVFTGVLDEVSSGFEHTTGHKVTFVYETAGAIRKRVQAGDIGDVTILPRPMMTKSCGKVGSLPAVSLTAHSAVGVAARAGAPKPDISSVDGFRHSLLAAKSIRLCRSNAWWCNRGSIQARA